MLGRSGRHSSRSAARGSGRGVFEGSKDGSTSRPGMGEFRSGRLVTPSMIRRNDDL